MSLQCRQNGRLTQRRRSRRYSTNLLWRIEELSFVDEKVQEGASKLHNALKSIRQFLTDDFLDILVTPVVDVLHLMNEICSLKCELEGEIFQLKRDNETLEDYLLTQKKKLKETNHSAFAAEDEFLDEKKKLLDQISSMKSELFKLKSKVSTLKDELFEKNILLGQFFQNSSDDAESTKITKPPSTINKGIQCSLEGFKLTQNHQKTRKNGRRRRRAMSDVGFSPTYLKLPEIRKVDCDTHPSMGLNSTMVKDNPVEKPFVNEPSDLSVYNEYSIHSMLRLIQGIPFLALVVLTSMSGYVMAPAAFDLSTLILCSFGTGLLSCAANAINQFHEVPFDAQMARTRNRLLVRYVITPLHAVGFASVCATSGLSMLYFGVNGMTAALGLTNLILYTSIYTPLKRVSILNTWVGSVVGALPPLMGWSACTGGLEAGAWILAGVLYAWQFPHFNALSWNLRPDYSRAGYRMMAVTDPGLCRRTTLRYTAAIILLSCSAPLVDLTNYWFVLESLPLNGYFTYLAWKFYKESDSATSRKLFRFSLIHLPALLLLMIINKKYWTPRSGSEEGPLENNLVSDVT